MSLSKEEFAKVEMRLGKVLAAERVVDTDKLLRLSVDFGEEAPRQVISGIAAYTAPEALVGRLFPFVTNLEPRTIRGLESQAMIVAAHVPDGPFSLLEPATADMPPGARLN